MGVVGSCPLCPRYLLVLTPDELKRFMDSDERSPGVAEAQRAFGFSCLTGLRISDIKALRWSDIRETKKRTRL